MYKEELIDEVISATGYPRKVVLTILNAVVQIIQRELSVGNSVSIAGIGTFKTAHRAPRVGRNPRTGETIPIEESTVPVFKPASKLKEIVKEGGN